MSLEVKQFSIRNFIADFPRMLNEAFKTICDCINKFYDTKTETLNAQKANIDYITATTISAQNLRVTDSSTGTYDFESILERLTNLENQVKDIYPITPEMIEDDINTRPPYRVDSSFYE